MTENRGDIWLHNPSHSTVAKHTIITGHVIRCDDTQIINFQIDAYLSHTAILIQNLFQSGRLSASQDICILFCVLSILGPDFFGVTGLWGINQVHEVKQVSFFFLFSCSWRLSATVCSVSQSIWKLHSPSECLQWPRRLPGWKWRTIVRWDKELQNKIDHIVRCILSVTFQKGCDSWKCLAILLPPPPLFFVISFPFCFNFGYHIAVMGIS